jgi:hypothetical protein
MASPSAPPVLSTYENSSRWVSRDDGVSVSLPNGTDLWIFGDTAVFQSNGSGPMAMTRLIRGGTAAAGSYTPGRIPSSLEEVPSPGHPPALSPNNPPAPSMPTPTDVYLPNGSGNRCTTGPGQYSARWAMGAVIIPQTPEVLITYTEVCVTNGGAISAEGWGFLEYNWRTGAIDAGPDDVFRPLRSGVPLPSHLSLGNPVITGNQVTLYSATCTKLFVGCGAGQVYATTLADDRATLANQASYHVAPIATDRSTAWHPVGLAVTAYPDVPYRMIETTAITGTYDVLTATTPAGPWHLETTGTVPGCQSLARGFCYGLIGHPELSTSSQLVITYYDPGTGPPTNLGGPAGHLLGVGVSYGAPPPGP